MANNGPGTKGPKRASLNRDDTIWEWTVIEPVRIPRKDGSRTDPGYRCECSCSTPETRVVREVLTHHLRSSNTKSCGHYRASGDWRPEPKPKITGLSIAVTIKAHVLSGNLESHEDYETIRRTWNSIKQRCFNPNNDAYADYGGRGITVHKPWIEDSNAFIRWVIENLGRRPEGHSIDRISVNGDYAPGNLRWATLFQQASNTRAQLDPMNGIVQTPKASTWGYVIHRGKEKFAEYGFASPDAAAAGRDDLSHMLDNGGTAAARALIRDRTAGRARARQDSIETTRQEAQAAKDVAREAKMNARQARLLADKAEAKLRRDERQAEHAGRAARYHRMNQTMSLSDIARKEGVSVAHVSTELKRHGYEAAAMKNSTGFPGVKQVTKGARTYFEARMVIDGKRKTLGQRKTAEEAYELILAAKAEQAEKPGPQPSQVSDPKRRPRRVQVRAA